MTDKQTILSGIRPTGRLHIGNYLGSVANFLQLQNEYRCFFFIADFHSLNESFDPAGKYDQIIDVARTYLAAGLDPKKCTLFVQSHVPQHAELAIILSNIIPASFLFRMTQYKEKSTDRSQENVNAGLLFYPVLMAADILMYKATRVPVGQDQTQHVELTRDAAAFFNSQFGKTFPEPQPLYTQTPKVMSLLVPDKKMAKSLGDGHCIYLDDEPETITKKIARAVTDTGDGKSVGAQNLLSLVEIFCAAPTYKKFNADQRAGTIRYADLKKALAGGIADYFADFRQKKKKLTQPQIEKILAAGASDAQTVAAQTMEEVRKKIGLTRR
ncbi:MAG: tryptophan--tRNA ligase [Candidatus Buchananbacteria bacterium RIFCSPHIGHO2_01_FULL_47_11b]|uniref:Tryptophan--tRNA ligase n=1 Tax=Candidatus Buchananbacteria bacterium RIFCSPHIGHO2_01_FULL_47_11b TaxID=1797537 RepID=A0A1G1Y3H2_9BACT|nr:MAG: tryptophan--tRNA ligase [Candidatus Buchananbacteria bacterium RIFCSPHIGHO2_01_FULL_47_11b]